MTTAAGIAQAYLHRLWRPYRHSEDDGRNSILRVVRDYTNLHKSRRLPKCPKISDLKPMFQISNLCALSLSFLSQSLAALLGVRASGLTTSTVLKPVTTTLLLVLWMAVALLSTPASADNANHWTTVKFRAFESPDDTRYAYFRDLIFEILETTRDSYGGYAVHATRQMNLRRSLRELAEGDNINILWSPSSKQLEETFLPIRIPLLKGLEGKRVLLINQGNQARFRGITSLQQLQALTAGQVLGDIAIEVLRHNQLPVVESPTYQSAFSMLEKGRFDYFSRSVLDAYHELTAMRPHHATMHIEERLILAYDQPTYFFVRKGDTALKQRIESGLERIMANGLFERIFNRHHEQILHRAALATRTQIALENPLLARTSAVQD